MWTLTLTRVKSFENHCNKSNFRSNLTFILLFRNLTCKCKKWMHFQSHKLQLLRKKRKSNGKTFLQSINTTLNGNKNNTRSWNYLSWSKREVKIQLKFINNKKSNELNEAQSPMWVINIIKWACLLYSLGF